MPVEEFERLVRIGSGRPLAYLADGHDPTPYRAVIDASSLEDWAFDSSSEPSRGQYVLDLLRASGRFDELRPRILAHIATSTLDIDEDPDLEQALDVAAILASGGDAEATAALYTALGRSSSPDSIAFRILDHGWLADVLALATAIGQGLLDHSDEGRRMGSDWTLKELRSQFGDRRVGNMLTKAARSDVRIAAFFDTARREARNSAALKRRRRADRPTPLFEDIRPKLSVDPYYRVRGHLLSWGKRASEDEIRRAAHALLNSSDEREVRNLLFVFLRRTFPLDPIPLIALVTKAQAPARELSATNEQLIGSTSAEVLTRMPGAPTRRLAIELSDRPGWESEAVELLLANYAPHDGDADRIARLFLQETDPNWRHGMTQDVLQLLEGSEALPDGIPELLMLSYELGACAYCRSRVVEVLRTHSALPTWVMHEGRWDASPETRKLLAGVDLDHEIGVIGQTPDRAGWPSRR